MKKEKNIKTKQNNNLKKKKVIMALAIILVLTISIIMYLFLTKSTEQNQTFKPKTSTPLTSINFDSCNFEDDEQCEYTETIGDKTIKLSYLTNHVDNMGDALLMLNDEIILENFYEIKNDIYFINDNIILGVENLEHTNIIIYVLDLEGKELLKIENLDEKNPTLKATGFSVQDGEIRIEASALDDEFHYLYYNEEVTENLYVCNYKDNDLTGKEIVSANFIIKYNQKNELGSITIDKKSITKINEYTETIDCETKLDLVGETEEPVIDEPVD